MNHRHLTKPRILRSAILIGAAALTVRAQNYSIDWHQFSVPGLSSGGSFSLAGNAGQADSTPTLTGGTFSLTGGFSAIYAIQTPGAPLLSISYAGNQAILSWPAIVTGWTFQTNANLATGNWGNYLGPVVNNTVTNGPVNGNLFFRLAHP